MGALFPSDLASPNSLLSSPCSPHSFTAHFLFISKSKSGKGSVLKGPDLGRQGGEIGSPGAMERQGDCPFWGGSQGTELDA